MNQLVEDIIGFEYKYFKVKKVRLVLKEEMVYEQANHFKLVNQITGYRTLITKKAVHVLREENAELNNTIFAGGEVSEGKTEGYYNEGDIL